jgi:L-gulonate 3-dehydrogenase
MIFLLPQSEQQQIIFLHLQVNPPYYVPLVEVVPAPWTEESVVTKTRDIMKEVGQVPVCFNKEIEGFALNRIQ